MSQADVGKGVFISHSSQDMECVENELISFLKKNGLEPWYSNDDIRTADHWERQILAALKRSEWFLIVLSPSAAVSEWVKDELHWAITHKNKRIIPVLIEKCDLHDFHIRLSRIEFVDYYADPEKARRRTLAAIFRRTATDAGISVPEVSRKRWWEF
jgi:hypothetical protein